MPARLPGRVSTRPGRDGGREREKRVSSTRYSAVTRVAGGSKVAISITELTSADTPAARRHLAIAIVNFAMFIRGSAAAFAAQSAESTNKNAGIIPTGYRGLTLASER
jgi:hypothetical protein